MKKLKRIEIKKIIMENNKKNYEKKTLKKHNQKNSQNLYPKNKK